MGKSSSQCLSLLLTTLEPERVGQGQMALLIISFEIKNTTNNKLYLQNVFVFQIIRKQRVKNLTKALYVNSLWFSGLVAFPELYCNWSV